MRLDQLLARNVGCSRAIARQMLHASGIDPLIEPEQLPIELCIDGRTITIYDAFHAVLNKPANVVTALTDAQHATAYELLRDAPLFEALRPVGRLDLETTGLLLWTTDGQWLQRLTHPKRAVPRTYQAALARPFGSPPPDFELEDGYRPTIVNLATIESARELHPSLLRPAETAAYATITVAGGAYHEVRRIFAALGSHVLALCRVGFGRLALPSDLPSGHYRQILPDDV